MDENWSNEYRRCLVSSCNYQQVAVGDLNLRLALHSSLAFPPEEVHLEHNYACITPPTFADTDDTTSLGPLCFTSSLIILRVLGHVGINGLEDVAFPCGKENGIKPLGT